MIEHEYDLCDDGCFDTSTSHNNDKVVKKNVFDYKDEEPTQTGAANYRSLNDIIKELANMIE